MNLSYTELYVDEEDLRMGLFLSNVEMVKNGQFLFDSGQRTYDMKMNCFGDLSFGEFASEYLGFGVLGGNNIDIDPGIEPLTQFNIDTITRRNYRTSEGLDWSLTGKRQCNVQYPCAIFVSQES